MASWNPKSIVVALFLLAIVISPALPCEAARLPHRGILQNDDGPVCIACECCAPPPSPDKCCICCFQIPPPPPQ
ncbi:hypothetical protein DCAR_0208580 [Daucus carota subsp. sativus]|uniref:Uncharacterized protein n=1 Tax=Daucus carota subsp. sativus TaxID=79200 RepID=A0A166EMC6_DAUCS|nr:hypothetical protein DCAR_0208580 [Daucus carota subsp. sativus]